MPSGGLEAERVNLAELERARAVARERVGNGYADDLIDDLEQAIVQEA